MNAEIIYKKYYEDCHKVDAGDFSKSKPAQRLNISQQMPYWTGAGTAGLFMWRALSTVYTPEVHKINEVKKSYNHHHDNCRCRGGVGMLNMVIESLRNDPLI